MRKILRKICIILRKKIKKSKNGSIKKKLLLKLYKFLLYYAYPKNIKNKVITTIEKYEPNSNYSGKSLKNKIRNILYYKNMYFAKIEEYYLLELYTHTENEVKDFIFSSQASKYLRYLNPNILHITSNKYKTYEVYKKFFKREVALIDSSSYKGFEKFIKKHPIFVKKTLNSAFGKGVELIDSTGQNKKELFDKLIYENKKFLVEEKIEQGKEMKVLNESSVNTLRIIPFIKDGKCIIHKPFMKIGQNGSFVDNGGAGGILVAIDANTGIAISDGVDEKLNRYEVHPNSKIKFQGFQVPKWDEVKKLALEVAKVHDGGRYIGFDFAYSTNGWVVVEANGRTQFLGQQMTLRKGMKKEMEALIDWKNVPNKERFSKK